MQNHIYLSKRAYQKPILKRVHHSICAIISLTLLFQQTCYPVSGDSHIQESVIVEQIIDINGDIGYVVEEDVNNQQNQENPIIFYLQDAHSNEGAQRNVSRLIEQINENYGLDLICVEGAKGLFETQLYNSYPDLEVKAAVGETLMKEGYISGVEKAVFDIVDGPDIYGIEDEALYLKNRDYFLKVHDKKAQSQHYIKKFGESLEELGSKMLGEPSNDYIKRNVAYRKGEIELDVYLNYLEGIWEKSGRELPPYQGLRAYGEFMEKEKSVNMSALRAEIRMLMEQLMTRMEREELKSFVKKTMLYRKGDIGKRKYFRYLESKTKEIGIRTSFVNLAKYLAYLEQRDAVNLNVLERELEDFDKDVAEIVFEGEEKNEWYQLWVIYNLGSRLLNLELSPREYDNLKYVNLKNLENRLNALYKEVGLEQDLALPELDETTIENAKQFYQTALERDNTLAANAIAEIKRRHVKSGLIITGGFHREGVLKALRDGFFRYIVIVPAVGNELERKKYLSRMTQEPLGLDAFSESLLSQLAPSMEMNPLISNIQESNGLLARFKALVGALFQVLGIAKLMRREPGLSKDGIRASLTKLWRGWRQEGAPVIDWQRSRIGETDFDLVWKGSPLRSGSSIRRSPLVFTLAGIILSVTLFLSACSGSMEGPGLSDTVDGDRDGLSDVQETDTYGTDPADADTDNDTLEDGPEVDAGTDPLDADTDDDALNDGAEVNDEGTDPLDPDTDGDGMPDGWEVEHGLDPLDEADAALDPDEDGLSHVDEYLNGTDPHDADTDNDGMPDGWEVTNGFDPLDPADGAEDADGDGLGNAQELENGTDVNNADTDGDGMPDGWEVENGLNPTDNDAGDNADADGMTNLEEFDLGTDPRNADTDGDGLSDSWEVDHGLDPLDGSDAALDPDSDGLTNLQESTYGTDPNNADTDGDGFSDAEEVASGSDPLVPNAGMTLLDEDFSYANVADALAAGWSIQTAPDYTPGHITWSVDGGVLNSTVNNPPESAYDFSYFVYPGLDISDLKIEVEFDISFNPDSGWGGIRYRGIDIDINPNRIGIFSEFITSGLLFTNNTYHIKIVFYPEVPGDTPRYDFFIDGIQVLWSIPISSAITENYLGFMSANMNGVTGFDNLEVNVVPNVISTRTKEGIKSLFEKMKDMLPEGLAGKVIQLMNSIEAASHFNESTGQIWLSSEITYRLMYLLHLMSGMKIESFDEYVRGERLHELYHALLSSKKTEIGNVFGFLREDEAFISRFVERFGEKYRDDLEEMAAKALSAMNSGADRDVFGDLILERISLGLAEIRYDETSYLYELLVLGQEEQKSTLENRLIEANGRRVAFQTSDQLTDEAWVILEGLSASEEAIREFFPDSADTLQQRILEALTDFTPREEIRFRDRRLSDRSA